MIATRRPRFLPDPEQGESTFLGDLLRKEAVGGTIALGAAVVALVWANLAGSSYADLQHWRIGPLDLEAWAADGALALFFFLAGLELKRELLVGSLRRPADAAVPMVAAVSGVAAPALIYVVVNALGGGDLRGWAVPSATDIAFALAVLALVGRHLPQQLRAFLLTLAVVDDLVVIVIIALFYSGSIHLWFLAASLAIAAAYWGLQRLRVRTSLVFLPVAVASWWFLHESGVHATIAGVLLGLLTRVRPDDGEQRSPAERLEHRIAPLSAGVAVPLFALLSAGVTISGIGGDALPVALGVVLGLVVGKPLGVLAGCWTVTRFTRAELDDAVSWRDLVGIAILAGVGFTVSLLVSDLAFGAPESDGAKAGVLLASLVAAALASAVLVRRGRVHRMAAARESGE